MLINTKNLVSITDANQNFSNITNVVDNEGMAVIMKRNRPKYVVFSITDEIDIQLNDQELLAVSKKIIDKNKEAFLKLAK